MAMVYTLVTSAKEWLSEKYGHEDTVEDAEDTDAPKDAVVLVFQAGALMLVDNGIRCIDEFEKMNIRDQDNEQ